MDNRDRQYRVLPSALAQKLTPQRRQAFRAAGYLMPIAGADGEGEGAGSGSGSGSGSGQEGESSSGSESDDDSGDGDDDGEGDEDGDDDTEGRQKGKKGGKDEDDDDGDNVSLSKSEYERLRRVAREHDQDKKNRDKEQQKQKERLQKEQGQYEELLAEKDEQIKAVEADRDSARFELDQYKRRVRVTDAAKRLNFKDPEDAFRFLTDEDTENDTSTERALKRLAKAKSYLVSERRSTGAPVNGDGAGILTMEQIKNLSPQEVNSRWDEVQKSLAAHSTN